MICAKQIPFWDSTGGLPDKFLRLKFKRMENWTRESERLEQSGKRGAVCNSNIPRSLASDGRTCLLQKKQDVRLSLLERNEEMEKL